MKKIILGSYVLVALLAAFQIQAVGKNGAGVNPKAGQGIMLGTDPASRPPVGNLGTTPDSRPPVMDPYDECEKLVGSGSKMACPKRPIHRGLAKRRAVLGDNPSTFTPSQTQLEILRLSGEFYQAAEFMNEVAQGLANLRKDDPSTFEKYFRDKDSLREPTAFASDLEPSPELAK